MIKHYKKIAFRNLWKYKSQTLVSVAGLAVGFVCFAMSTLRIRGTENHFHVTFDKEITVPSQTVCEIKNRKEQFIKEAEIIYCSDSDSGTDVQSFKTAQPGQDDLSEYKTPMGLLPP
jgi:hypothetical protein